MRSPTGEDLVLQKNVFVERILPSSVMRDLEPEVMDRYRKPYVAPESRRPVLQWPREIPFDGKPADVADAMTATASWLLQTPLPKLYIDADPGFLSMPQREFCRRFRNQTEVRVRGIHFIQEDAPEEIGDAV